MVYQLKVHRFIKGALSTAFIVFALAPLLFYVGHYLVFAKPVINDTVHALWQSDLAETLEFLESNISLWWILVAVLLVISATAILSFKRRPLRRYPAIVFVVFLLLPTLVVFANQGSLNPMFLSFERGTNEYFQELEEYKEWRQRRSNSSSLPVASTSEGRRTTVLILGESANKNHMSIYGYPRQTTPNVDELFDNGELIRFSRGYSSHTHTGNTVAHALTQADQYTPSNWATAPSLIEVAKSVDVETIWISNQQTFGAWDNQVSVLAQDADLVVSKNKRIGKAKDAYKFDESLLPVLEKTLERDSEQKFIVLHLQGSHASYCRRFPKLYSPFARSKIEKHDFGGVAWRPDTGLINCYDNSIFYTDHVIQKVIDLLDQRKEPASLIYIADHSEDIFGGRAHNSAAFTYNMTEIPLVFWANSRWQQSYSQLWSNLSENSSKVFTNDHMFETLIGLLGIRSQDVDESNDLSSSGFNSVNGPLTLLGKKKLDASENWRYWQDDNALDIRAKDQCSKILPHRTNTVGKIKSALNSGFCGLEIDVLVTKDENEDFIFSVGHGPKLLTGQSLEELLDVVKKKPISKLWLDIKNLNPKNINAAFIKLNELNAQYALKSRVIIETSYHGLESRLFSDAGYELAYYLPTGKVLEVISESSVGDPQRKELARELMRRINTMQPKAISFDLRLYPFVKSYLELGLPDDVNYHTWFPDNLKLYTPKLLQELGRKNYYNDSRVETILVHYHSPYHY